jgi:hypothetical protein
MILLVIKRGAQYLVYPFFGGRVRKVPHSLARAVQIWNGWKDVSKESVHDKALEAIEVRDRSIAFFKERIQENAELFEYLGKPKFYRRGVYTQERVKTLGAALRNQTQEENLLLIEKYAQACLNEWRFGFSEGVFNFTVNSGINKVGDVVLIDFGEVTFDPEVIKKAIKQRLWLESWSYKHDLPIGLKRHYASIMARTLTLSEFERFWP